MKLQLIEAFKGGHHTNYIEALLPALRRCLAESKLSEVVINVTKSHYELLVRDGIAKKEDCNLRLIPDFPEIDSNPNLMERYQLFKALKKSIQSESPDVLICTYADYDIMFNALFSGFAPQVNKLGVIHYGYPYEEKLTFKEKIKQKIYETSWKYSGWDKLLFVNPVVYESMLKRQAHLSSKVHLLPDPVQSGAEISASEARQQLGIPTEGIYFGFVGIMDRRKAIPELLSGYIDSGAYKFSRLLLAGVIWQNYFELIQRKYQTLVDSRQIILINRHLTAEEVQLGYAAVDIHTLLQYRRMNLSANLLKAVSSKKMIIVDDCGYTGMMTKRFNLGLTCNISKADSVAEAMRSAFRLCPSFVPSEHTKRLVEFHHPENYANTIINLALKTDALPVKHWDWVCEDLN
jgi:glycosyltransferase involved in cell wall biosynthesis